MRDSRQVFLARQPILDRHRRLVAYELLFRDSVDARSARVGEAPAASAQVAINAFLSMGVSTVLGPHRGFLNVDLEMLASEAIEALPADRIVLEVLETVPPWAAERCRELRSRGFALALDDYVPGDARRDLLPAADFVKVDLMMTEKRSLPRLMRQLRESRACPLAEKVEIPEEFEACLELGFELFQGYFFAHPTTLTGRRPDPERVGLLAAFRAISTDRPREELEDVFKRHARLGVQLLRIANSVALGSVQKITGFAHAIMFVGRRQLRRWILLMLYATGQAESRANPTLELAALRGRVLELLTPLLTDGGVGTEDATEHAFLAGMLSLGDVILDAKMVDVLDELQVESPVRAAVLEHQGPLGRLLEVAEAAEGGHFARLTGLLEPLGLSVEQLAHAQREAWDWYRQMHSPEGATALS